MTEEELISEAGYVVAELRRVVSGAYVHDAGQVLVALDSDLRAFIDRSNNKKADILWIRKWIDHGKVVIGHIRQDSIPSLGKG